MASLSQKDKKALMLLGIVLGIFVVIQFAFSPLIAQRNQLERKIKSKKSGLQEMQEMQNAIKQLSLRSNSLEQMVAARPADFSLFAFLEEKCAETLVKDNISYMKPSDPSGDGAVQQIMVEMKLKAIRLNFLIAFLERIESTQHIVALKRISIQVNKKDRGTLDVIMQVISLVQTEIISD
ncbi:MAG: type II secretion system protein GspM [Candidatus Electrothrix sp. Rat3]|nr:type II secretion system protein GspM [Candidatus Electrothrix rattekaaiensis]